MRKPILDPQRDLAGATPETLAGALLRPSPKGKDKDADEEKRNKPVCAGNKRG